MSLRAFFVIPRLSRRKTGGAVLFEVIVAMVILGISIAAIMRSFTISMSAIRKNDIATQGFILAETLLQELETTPLVKGVHKGDFSQDGFPAYYWEITIDKVDIKYPAIKSKPTNLRGYTKGHLKITYDDGRNPVQTPVQVELIFPPVERFSFESKFRNELFRKEEGI